MSALWTLIFGFLPAWVQVLVLGLISLLVIILVLRVIGMVLDSIPFL